MISDRAAANSSPDAKARYVARGSATSTATAKIEGQRSMPASTERILVSHAGALPRPDALQRLFGAGPGFEDAIDAALPGAVAEVVDRQAAVGVDIVNDGEISKRGLFTGYIRDRMSGFEAEAGGDRPSANAGVTGRDRRDFPGFFAAGLGGFDFKGAMPAPEVTSLATRYVCTGPLRYAGTALVQADIDRLTAAAGAHNVTAFLPAITPGTVEHWLRNDYYPDDESFLGAIADVLHEEYTAITDAGLLLQLDDPDLPDGWQMFPDMTVPEYRRYAALRVEALNHALRGIPPERVRLHVCWGSGHGPHRDDIPLRDIIDLVLSVPAGCYSIEAANPRHEHEWTRLGGREAAGWRVADARRGGARNRRHRAPRTGRPAPAPVREAGRRGERNRRHRLWPRQPGRPPGDRLGEARGSIRRRPDRLPRPVQGLTMSDARRRSRRGRAGRSGGKRYTAGAR